jgi:hypothetical protein
VSEFAPPSCQRFLSYIVGWLGVLGWQTAAATVSYLSGKQIQGIIVLNNPSYEPQPWHGTLLIWAILSICCLFNTFFSRKLPLVEGMIVVLHVAGFFAVIIPLWVMGDRGDTGDVFTKFEDNSGWNNLPLSTIIGLVGAASTFVGSEAGVHMAEEVRDAAYVVPRAMMWTWLGNGLLGWIMAITFCFCVGDTMSVLLTPTGTPFIQVFLNTTGSVGGATGLTVLMLVIGTFACVAVMATNSRQLFAFARDNGVPFSHIFSKASRFGLKQTCSDADSKIGLPHSRSTPQRSLLNTRIRNSTLTHQSGIQRGIHAGRLPWHRFHAHFLSHLHLLRCFEKSSRRTIVAIKVQFGQVRSAHQHHLGVVPVVPLDLLFLPCSTQPWSGRNELGCPRVWLCSHLRGRLLRSPREIQVCRAS